MRMISTQKLRLERMLLSTPLSLALLVLRFFVTCHHQRRGAGGGAGRSVVGCSTMSGGDKGHASGRHPHSWWVGGWVGPCVRQWARWRECMDERRHP